MKNKNHETLDSFIKYCDSHPEQRLWQALRNWSEENFIWASDERNSDPSFKDTFYWKGKNK